MSARLPRIHSLSEALALLRGRRVRRIGHNTRLRDCPSGKIIVEYHETAVVTYKPNGETTLNTAGWRTPTTKHRLNACSPVRVWSDRGVWYASLDGACPTCDGEGVGDGDGMCPTCDGDGNNTVTYRDGLTVRDGAFVPETTGPSPAVLREERKRAQTYARAYTTALSRGEITLSDGDCVLCRFDANSTMPLGDHIDAHIDERYYPAALALAAIRHFPVSRAAEWWLDARLTRQEPPDHWAEGICHEQVRKSITRYCYRALGLPS